MSPMQKMLEALKAGLKFLVISLLGLGSATSNAADTIKGGQIYASYCASCHGVNGVPLMSDAPNFARSERLLRPDVFVVTAIREGKNSMPSYQGVLSDSEILDVVVYLRTLEKVGPATP